MCHCIGEYISLELLYFVNLTSSCTLIPWINLANGSSGQLNSWDADLGEGEKRNVVNDLENGTCVG